MREALPRATNFARKVDACGGDSCLRHMEQLHCGMRTKKRDSSHGRSLGSLFAGVINHRGIEPGIVCARLVLLPADRSNCLGTCRQKDVAGDGGAARELSGIFNGDFHT